MPQNWKLGVSYRKYGGPQCAAQTSDLFYSSTALGESPLYFVKTTVTFLFLSPVEGTTTSFLSFQGHPHQLRLRGDLRVILAIHGWDTVSLLGLRMSARHRHSMPERKWK